MLPPDTGAAGVKMSLLEGGEVVAVAPVAAGRRYVDIASGRLAFVPLADPAPNLPIDLLWHPSAVQRREVAAFVDPVREVGTAGALVPGPVGIH